MLTHQVGNHLVCQFRQAVFRGPAETRHLFFQQADKIIAAYLTITGRLLLIGRQHGRIIMNKGNNGFALGGSKNVFAVQLAEPHGRQGAVAPPHDQDKIIAGFDQLLDHRQQGIAICSGTVQAGGYHAVLNHRQHQCLARALHIGKGGTDKDLVAFRRCHPGYL